MPLNHIKPFRIYLEYSAFWISRQEHEEDIYIRKHVLWGKFENGENLVKISKSKEGPPGPSLSVPESSQLHFA